MRILILHLSDMHFREDRRYIIERIDQIRGAIQASIANVSACIVAVSGDVAFSGKRQEYEIANVFFDGLGDAIKSISPHLEVIEVFIPGNHDCDFAGDQRSRDLNIADILKKLPETDDQNDSRIAACLMVQESFFDFISRRLSSTSPFSPSHKQSSTANISLKDKHVRFHCYNTAWLSRWGEKQGELLAPTWIAVDKSPCDLSISLLHHPYNWLEAVNAKTAREEIESSSDIILTGHEHVAEQFTKITISGEATNYLEGAVLQGDNDTECGFNIVVLDLDERKYKVGLYTLKDDIFSCQEQKDWQPFVRNRTLKSRTFENTKEFFEYLTDTGTPFTHPRVPKLKLADIFVYPDLEDQSFTGTKTDDSRLIQSGFFIPYVLEHKQIAIAGSDFSGKTALTKALYSDLQRNELAPILVSGNLLRSPSEIAFFRLLDSCIESQYGVNMVEHYRQFDRRRKAIIVDDFHKARLNPRARNTMIELIETEFDIVIIVADELFTLNELLQPEGEKSALLPFRHCRIKQFGHRLRGKLIERWIGLGQEDVADPRELTRSVTAIEKIVSTVIGNHLLPAYPLFVLSILQGSEAGTPHNTMSGSYGYYCEALIINALARSLQTVSANTSSRAIPEDTIHTFVSNMAYRLFEQQATGLSSVEVEDLIQEYQKKYVIDFDKKTMMRILEESWILKIEKDESCSFRYKYVYFYFVAKYFAQSMHTSLYEVKLRNQISDMIDKIHVEDYSNIVIFLVFLTKDEQTINQVLQASKRLFSEHDPCNLDSHVGFMSKLTGDVLQFRLVAKSHTEAQEDVRKRRDELEQLIDDDTEIENTGSAESDDRDEPLDEALQLNVALKTLQIMGQILRNFPGSLSGDTKILITRESYLLGLRALQSLLASVSNNIDTLRSALSELWQQKYRVRDEGELAQRVDEMIYILALYIAYGLVKHVSHAVGSEHLEKIYERIADPQIETSIDLINTQIKLDHARQFPKKEVEALYDMLKKNKVATNILRGMVRDHFYLYPEPIQTRDSVCDRLKINIKGRRSQQLRARKRR